MIAPYSTCDLRSIGRCQSCGGERYELLAHMCGTAVSGSWLFPAALAVQTSGDPKNEATD